MLLNIAKLFAVAELGLNDCAFRQLTCGKVPTKFFLYFIKNRTAFTNQY